MVGRTGGRTIRRKKKRNGAVVARRGGILPAGTRYRRSIKFPENALL
jgi:hypothetical protein